MKYTIDTRDYPGFGKGATRTDHMAHGLMAFNPIGLHGATVEGEYIAFYHEERLYSVRNTKENTLLLIYAGNPHEAIQKAKGGQNNE